MTMPKKYIANFMIRLTDEQARKLVAAAQLRLVRPAVLARQLIEKGLK